MNLPATDIQTYTLSLTRDFNAPREKVFQAWTDPEIITKWFGPKGVSTESAQIDLKVGGRYQFTLKLPDGKISNHHGEYREIDPPHKLVFTGILDGQSCSGSEGLYAETLVTIELQDLGSSTRLTLTHEFFPNEESKESHNMGWNGSFDCLEEVLA
jgi:uncharacterized protein YndB with AHSA1/START domain